VYCGIRLEKRRDCFFCHFDQRACPGATAAKQALRFYEPGPGPRRNLLTWNCTRLPTPETAFSLCAGTRLPSPHTAGRSNASISGNGRQAPSEQGFSHSFEMTIRAELLRLFEREEINSCGMARYGKLHHCLRLRIIEPGWGAKPAPYDMAAAAHRSKGRICQRRLSFQDGGQLQRLLRQVKDMTQHICRPHALSCFHFKDHISCCCR